MTKKLWTLMSLLMVFAMVLAACSPAATTEPTEVVVEPTQPVAEPTKEVVVEPTATTGPVEPIATIRVWADDTRAPILEELAADFLAAYNVELLIELKADPRGDFLVAAPVGEGPDIVFGVPHDQMPSMVVNGLLAPVDLGDKVGDFLPVAVEACTIDGVLYCLPYATENLGLFYNTDLVTEAPATWDELIAVGEALKAEGKVEWALALPGNLDYNGYPLWTAFGGYVFGKTAEGAWDDTDVGLDSEGMIAGVQWLADLAAKGSVPTDTDWGVNHALFEEGKAPFIMAGPWALDRIRESGVKYAIADFFPSGPAGEGRPFAGTQGALINAQSENVLLAQAFLTEFVATEAVMTKLVAAGNRPSAYLPVRESYEDADLVAMGKAGANAEMMPNIPAMGAVWSNWNNGIVPAMSAQSTADVSMKDAASKVRNVIANPLTGMVNVPGSYQAKAGCAGDWAPDCKETQMTLGEDGKWVSGPFKLAVGEYEAKVAMDGTWTLNYGVDGKENGDNYKFSLTAESEVSFVFDPETKILTINIK